MALKEDLLHISGPPHIHSGESVTKIMWTVAGALTPACAFAALVSGTGVLFLISVAVMTAVASETLIQLILKRPVTALDGSAAVTGLLLAMIMPVETPLWMAAAGSFFAIIAVKQLFGGLGLNIFNPALSARALLMMIWPEHMSTTWQKIQESNFTTPVTAGVFGSASSLFGALTTTIHPSWPTLFGNSEGIIGASSAILLLAGALLLFFRKIVTWHIPFSFIGTVAAFDAIYYYTVGAPDLLILIIFHCLSGGLLLAVFFMATDPVTSPVSGKGMVFYGAGCGIITCVIRLFTGYTDGALWAILIMNAIVPFIDRFSKPRVFGTGGRIRL
jgi:Na+-translocating ferredoxin:NAD+ oxidoreductase subunit D